MKKNDLLIILASVFIFVFIWIGFNIYHSSVKSTISETVTIQISSVSPNFDTTSIEKLKNRQTVTPIFQTNGVVAQPTDQTQIAQPSINSSSSATTASSSSSLLP
jgi:ammonia channel protein AmtB